MSEKTWNTTANSLLNGTTGVIVCRHALWWIKNFLTGGTGISTGTWTVIQSCDGTSVNNIGVDLWGTTFDQSKIVSGVGSSAHSWIVLRSPNLNGSVWYLTIDYIVNGPAMIHSAGFFFSKIQPSNGTQTARPTASDEWSPQPNINGVYNGSAYFTANVSSGSGTAIGFRMNGSLSANGDFILWNTVDGNGLQFAYGFFGLSDSRPWDNYPVVSYWGQFVTGFQLNSMSFHSTYQSGSWSNNNLSFRARSYNGAEVLECPAMSPMWGVQFSGTVGVMHTNGVLSSANPYGTYDDFPIMLVGVYSAGTQNVSPHLSVKGRVPDLKFAPRAMSNGTMGVVGGVRESIKLVHCWVPYTSSDEPLL